MMRKLHNLDEAYSPIQRAAWARANLITATRTLQTALRELQKALADSTPAEDSDVVTHLDAVAAVWSDAMFEDDDPYGGLTNADVLSADELYGDEKADEIALDMADEERWHEENADRLYDDEDYDTDEDDEDGGEFDD